jgi:thiol:disulfide interchange protein DsbC
MKRNIFFGIVLVLWNNICLADAVDVGKRLRAMHPDIEFTSIKPALFPGLYEALAGAELYYFSEDGRYVFRGDVIDLHKRINVSELTLSEARLEILGKMNPDDFIVYSPPMMRRHSITVFTDIDCGYCRKLHASMDDFLRSGIEIRYGFYPRAGHGSESYKKAVSVWCSPDRKQALTRAKKGEPIAAVECKNPVDLQMKSAVALGATGTPFIITDKGHKISGYLPAKEMLEHLEGQRE